MYPSEQLARKVVSLSLRANELTNAIHMSKEHMDKLKSANQKLLRAEKQVTQTRLKEQKNHYETVVARHQEFIEQVTFAAAHSHVIAQIQSHHLNHGNCDTRSC